MDRVRTAWREDRRQFLYVFMFGALGVATFLQSSGDWPWVSGLLILAATVVQAYEVFVLRPRRLERTGQRSRPLYGSR